MGAVWRRKYSLGIKTFLYLHTEDLESARSFYSQVLGLEEISYSAEEGESTVGYRVGDLQITISRHAAADPVTGWAKQLGWAGGSESTPSWGFELPPVAFRRAIDAAKGADLDALHTEPVWVGYWSFPLRDPMGYTVEISSPDRNAWPAPG